MMGSPWTARTQICHRRSVPGSLARPRSSTGSLVQGGRGTCAESFAVHQLRLGRVEVAHDLLRFLDDRIAALRREDPDGLLPTTEMLADRDPTAPARRTTLGAVASYVEGD